ncbi:GNAT family N-acetyltransferase [Knoellia locipacati]|uniref:GNAT family N-acetyltransferase n=1 Tax=Knoellia locipacati TaxID=882824 RepID=UPI00384CCA26
MRVATREDLAAVQDVFWECWTGSYAAFAPPEVLARLSRADADGLWSDALGRDRTLVATDDDERVVGVVRFSADDVRLAVHSLYVSPAAQGQGIGGQLLDAVDKAVGDVSGSDLWVFCDNDTARSFYEGRGWLPDGATRVDDRFGMPEAHLTRTAPGRAARVLVGPGVCVTDSEKPPAGAVVGVWTARGESVVAAGVRDTAGTPMSPDTVHDLASVTKLVTTCAVMSLVSAGRLDLDAPVSKHVPWSGADPTIRQLLQHRAGLLPWQPLHHVARRREDVLAMLPGLPRSGGVGESFAYSDLSFITLGAVVEAVTGQSLDAALASLVTGPLGLGLHFRPAGRVDAADTLGDARTLDGAGTTTSTSTSTDEDIAESALDEGWEERMIATGEPYPVHLSPDPDLPPVVRRTGPIRGSVHDANAWHAMGGVSGHAGLFGSVPELLGLGRALVDTGHGLWSDDVVEEFTTPGPDPLQGLGFRVRPLPTAGLAGFGPEGAGPTVAGARRGSRLAWHPGFTGTALGVRLGAEPAVVAMATNRHLHDGVPVPTDRLWERVLQAELLSEEAHP